LCNRASGAIQGRLSIASTSTRHGHSPRCRVPIKKQRGANDGSLLVGRDAQFRKPKSAPSRTVRVRTSTKTSVPQSYPIRSISPLALRGVYFRATKTYTSQSRYQYAQVSPRSPPHDAKNQSRENHHARYRMILITDKITPSRNKNPAGPGQSDEHPRDP